MSKKARQSVIRVELGRAVLVLVFSSALGFAVNAYSSRPLAVFSAQPGQSDGPPHISMDELKTAWKRNDPILIVDVRDEAQYEIGHVPGSLNASVDAILNQERGTMSVIEGASKSGALIVTLCDSEQCSKAEHAADALLKSGHKNIRVLHGGWEAYFHSGAQVDEGARR